MKLLHIVGARPQFIKLAPMCRAIKEFNDSGSNNQLIESIVVHTGQHYDNHMSKVFFDDLQIPAPDYNLEVGSGRHGKQTALMLERVEDALLKEHPDMVIVYGDTNSTLAGALAASKLHIPIAHIEAGLRSYNRRMPEEINRVLTDHLSMLLFCPTETATQNLKKEGFLNMLNEGKWIDAQALSEKNFPSVRHSPLVINAGDIMFDSVLFSIKKAQENSNIMTNLGLLTQQYTPLPYVLCTIHRQENTDNRQRMEAILDSLNGIAENGAQIIFPVHPRTKKTVDKMDVKTPGLRIIDPVSYYDMLVLEKNARVILTDSGGVQKEAFFVCTPCITLRDETEWTETVEAGMNIVTGIKGEKILDAYNMMMNAHFGQNRHCAPSHYFGDGDTSKIVLQVILLYSLQPCSKFII